jgi:hypothetical protein
MKNEVFQWKVTVQGDMTDGGWGAWWNITDECGWDRESLADFIRQVEDRTHYTLEGYTGRIRYVKEVTVKTESIVEI